MTPRGGGRAKPQPPADLGPCSACQYWDTVGEGLAAGLGRCRVGSPGIVAGSTTWAAATAVWPVTWSDDWCGAWVAAAAKAGAAPIGTPTALERLGVTEEQAR